MGSRDSNPVLLPKHTLFPLPNGEITLGPELPQKYKTIWELFTFSSLVSPCFSSLVSWGLWYRETRTGLLLHQVKGSGDHTPGATCSLPFPPPIQIAQSPLMGLLELARSRSWHICQRAILSPWQGPLGLSFMKDECYVSFMAGETRNSRVQPAEEKTRTGFRHGRKSNTLHR